MKFTLFIALRYLFSKRKQTFISVISAVSILGITIGVASLVIALALVSGFQGEIQGKVLRATSAIMASPVSSRGIEDWKELCHRLEKFSFVKRAYPQAIIQALASSEYDIKPIMLRGLDPENLPDWIGGLMEGGIVIGDKLMEELGISPGDFITVYLPSVELTPFGPRAKARRVKVTGAFSSGLYILDNTSGAFPIGRGRELFSIKPEVNYINIDVDNIYRAEEYSEILEKEFPDLIFTPWNVINRTLFESLKLEKRIIFLVIALIVVVAALNIIASLVLLVMEKIKDIGILMSMGARRNDIAKIFMAQGTFIGIIGVLLGEIIGILASWAASTFRLIRIPADIYQIGYVPFHVKPLEAAGVGIFALIISFLSTIYPARKASKIDPSEAIRYE